MMKTIDYALKVYDEDPEAWKGIMTRAMQAKLDWDASADQYLKVFNSLIG
jgi:starch synthase